MTPSQNIVARLSLRLIFARDSTQSFFVEKVLELSVCNDVFQAGSFEAKSPPFFGVRSWIYKKKSSNMFRCVFVIFDPDPRILRSRYQVIARCCKLHSFTSFVQSSTLWSQSWNAEKEKQLGLVDGSVELTLFYRCHVFYVYLFN